MGIRLDPVSGMRVVVAPGRAHRPGAFVKTEPRAVRQTPEQCPFCAGHEDQTPPETLVLPAQGGGWGVRVVPNLFPALAPPDGRAGGRDPLAGARDARSSSCRRGMSSASARPGSGARPRTPRRDTEHVLCSINDGAGSGASLDHTHSQLTATALAAPLVALAARAVPGRVPRLRRARRLRRRCPYGRRGARRPGVRALGERAPVPAARRAADP